MDGYTHISDELKGKLIQHGVILRRRGFGYVQMLNELNHFFSCRLDRVRTENFLDYNDVVTSIWELTLGRVTDNGKI